MNDQLINELVELEDGFWDAAGTPRFYDDNFAEDGVIALPMGIMAKSEVMEAMEAAEPWSEHDMRSPRVIEINRDVAALVYRASARRVGQESDYEAVISSVYARRDGAWKLILHQQTPC